MQNHLQKLEALLRVPFIDPEGGFDLSPDGRQCAISWNRTGQWEIYSVMLDGSQPAVQLTHGPGAKFAPQWSPDGRQIAYIRDHDGGELYDIFTCNLDTGIHTNLTPGTPEAIQPGYSWSPDGCWIAFASERSGRFEAYILPATGGSVCPVAGPGFPVRKVRWSPDGGWLATEVDAHGQEVETYLAMVSGGEAIPIAENGIPIYAQDAHWSPDGRQIAFASNVHGRFEIGVYEMGTGQIGWISSQGGEAVAPDWSPDGRSLAFVLQQGPSTCLAILELSSGRLFTTQIAPGVHYRPTFTPDGTGLMLVFDNPCRPPDLWRLDLSTGRFEQMTNSFPAGSQGALFGLPREVSYPSLDGKPVPALLYEPYPTDPPKPEAGESKGKPAVVYVHGGPTWLSQITWDPLVQHMVSRGWTVLAPNYRGSTGYGRDWQLASQFDLGGRDTEDVAAGAIFLSEQGLADPARIAVTGRSYGGYLTMTNLTRFPELWAAGSAVVPFLNWFTGHKNSRKDLQHWDLENFGDPERDHDLYYQRSPYFFLEMICAPVQLICGAHDPRCPASESLQAKDKLLSLGKSCDLVLYSDEGHNFLKTENVIDAKSRLVRFLAGVLEKG